MSDQPTYQSPPQPQTTGRFLVTYREGAIGEATKQLEKNIGVRRVSRSSDFKDNASQPQDVEPDGMMVFEHIGVAVVDADPKAVSELVSEGVDKDSSILAVEPEYIMYAVCCSDRQTSASGSTSAPGYLLGYRDAVNHLCEQLAQPSEVTLAAAARRCFSDTNQSTWGLQATKVVDSRCSGRGITVAVLDTGMDLQHPDFVGRDITPKSFVSGETPQDGHGHGTHCIGTACGPRNPASGVRRYGCAYGSRVFAGKVLSNGGSGADAGILAGIDWAVANRCQVISMSLGARICQTTVAYEMAGQRSLAAGSLIVAAAGNSSNRRNGVFACVERPANSKSIMAVGALDNCLGIADFSCRNLGVDGGEVDIAAPGVNVFSSWPRPTLHNTISGTSMATPHVAGIAALFAEAFRARGFQLWQLLTSHASRLPLPSIDVGSGLVIAPGC